MPAHRRPRLVTALAVLLALESVTVVAARAAEIRDAQLAAAPSLPASIAPRLERGHPTTRLTWPAGPDVAADAIVVRPQPKPRAAVRAQTAPTARPRPAMNAVRPAAAPSPAGTAGSSRPGGTPKATFRGRNHVWSPALGISRSVHAFPCSRAAEPDDLVYRWGCAGRNNVYLLGHAANVFSGLNRAFYNGTLKRGLKVYYADSSGTVRTYAVRWWKVVYPTPDVDWAWASLPRPSMTLQTCIGKRSEKRLMVRLVQISD